MAGHNATAYPEEHLYVKSPAETKAEVEAAIEDVRVNYAVDMMEVERQYRHIAGVPDPNPPIEPPADEPVQPEAVTEDPPPAPAPPPAPRSTKKPSSTKK
jgi:hypothetical protein